MANGFHMISEELKRFRENAMRGHSTFMTRRLLNVITGTFALRCLTGRMPFISWTTRVSWQVTTGIWISISSASISERREIVDKVQDILGPDVIVGARRCFPSTRRRRHRMAPGGHIRGMRRVLHRSCGRRRKGLVEA